jgi:hypothetical protein
MLISMMGVIIILNLLQYRLLPKIDSAIKPDRINIRNKPPESHPPRVKNRDGKQYLYVFGMLLSQGLI